MRYRAIGSLSAPLIQRAKREQTPTRVPIPELSEADKSTASVPSSESNLLSKQGASLRGARGVRHARIGDVVRVEPGVANPALLVVVGHAGLGERYHLVVGAGALGIEQRLDADVLVVAGVVDLIELVARAERGSHPGP